MKKYAIMSSDEIVCFPVHETCLDRALTDYPGDYPLPIVLTAHRRRENCAVCNRPVCGAGNIPPSSDRSGNDWDFARSN